MNEDQLIYLLTAHWKNTRRVPQSVGDDCAVICPDPKMRMLFKTDAVVEDIHFTRGTPPSLIGRKAIARALSDIAAMGGSPLAALITLGIPKSLSTAKIRSLYQGMEKIARQFNLTLAGGETTRSAKLFLSISMLGETATNPVLRSTAQSEDLIWVTGRLGKSMPRKHLLFTPRVAEGQWLARQGLASAMMDLSDGLASDLPRLAKASRKGFYIEEESIPRTSGASLTEALSDGEDYELLFTTRPENRMRLESRWPFEVPLACIGVMTSRRQIPKLFQNTHGYDHIQHT